MSSKKNPSQINDKYDKNNNGPKIEHNIWMFFLTPIKTLFFLKFFRTLLSKFIKENFFFNFIHYFTLIFFSTPIYLFAINNKSLIFKFLINLISLLLTLNPYYF